MRSLFRLLLALSLGLSSIALAEQAVGDPTITIKEGPCVCTCGLPNAPGYDGTCYNHTEDGSWQPAPCTTTFIAPDNVPDCRVVALGVDRDPTGAIKGPGNSCTVSPAGASAPSPGQVGNGTVTCLNSRACVATYDAPITLIANPTFPPANAVQGTPDAPVLAFEFGAQVTPIDEAYEAVCKKKTVKYSISYTYHDENISGFNMGSYSGTDTDEHAYIPKMPEGVGYEMLLPPNVDAYVKAQVVPK